MSLIRYTQQPRTIYPYATTYRLNLIEARGSPKTKLLEATQSVCERERAREREELQRSEEDRGLF